ncbi:ABC transporter ATP-binding protein [Salinigranum marinum]|uniref:ABC transporter ATP-binding protein n=1 Tax=Salinigranum marinum TaxID=1515595 RepID=UPI002989E71B|nr:ABC transporter ATP-binding protein [Salinigranum marinum]
MTKRFGGIVAIDGVSVDIDAGPITGIIGPNGAGKTTLFNLIAGTYTPTEGSIRLHGEDVAGLPANEIAKRGIGRTFQIPRPFGEMTVEENLLVANYDLPAEERSARVDETLDLLDLTHQRDTEGENLSGGQQTLLEIGRVLMLDPDLILLDEPAAGVNPKLVDRIASLIETSRGDRTFVIVEHDVTLISRLCDRVLVLNEGRLIADGDINEIKNDPEVRQAYLGGGA